MRSEEKPDVCVVGLGYIGLPTAAVIARSGCRVLGIDISQRVVDTINRGEIHIEEVDLDGLVQGVVQRGLLRASTSIDPSDVFVIAVPTPFDEYHAPDISYVLDAARNVAKVLKAGDCVILESTSPVGTTEAMVDLMAELRPDLKMPGKILEELTNNDRSIGGITPRCARKALTFYKRFVRGECVTTDARSAEMTKLVENAYRDVNLAFANELSMVADKMGLDVWEVIRLANRHPRVNILQPGPGVGGHCIAVDPWFLVAGDPKNARIIRTAREVNEAKTDFVIGRAIRMIEEQPTAKFACLGLALNPNFDYVRESPAVTVAAALARRFGAQIQLVEPYAAALPKAFDGTGAALVELDDALTDCDLLIVLVDHDMFKSIPLDERADKRVYDTRGMWLDQPRTAATIAGLHRVA